MISSRPTYSELAAEMQLIRLAIHRVTHPQNYTPEQRKTGWNAILDADKRLVKQAVGKTVFISFGTDDGPMVA